MIGRTTLALVFLINTLFGLYTAAVMLRFLLQRVRADFYNPLSQAIVKITNPLVLPLRRLIPGWRGLDFAALALTSLLQLGNVLLVVWITSLPSGPVAIAYWTLLKLAFVLVNLYFFTILVEAILSWTGSGRQHPMAGVLWSVNAPLLKPARRLIPPLGGLDFSPLAVMLLLQVINILLPLQWPLV
ncbi:MAG: YggT family protein [Gammaproteobacteria bacterium]|nr:YggT family protein [Gammaproteobacteria bacterium]